MNDEGRLLEQLEERIGYHFRDQSLGIAALTHSSYVREHRQVGADPGPDYERLEFLGDAVLELVTSEMLMARFDWPEGPLTKARANIVCESSLSALAKELGLGSLLRLSRGEEKTGGRSRASILCDVMEAVIGAVYRDGGREKAEEMIHRLLFSHLTLEDIQEFDAKSALQELLQQRGEALPEYILIQARGPVHSPIFTMGLYLHHELKATGEGSSKQKAGQAAARAYLEQWKSQKNNRNKSIVDGTETN